MPNEFTTNVRCKNTNSWLRTYAGVALGVVAFGLVGSVAPAYAANAVEGATQATSMQDDLFDLLLRLGAGWVLWLLLILSVLAVALGLERLIFYIQERRPQVAVRAALEAVKHHNPQAAHEALSGHRGMSVAVVRTCLEHAPSGIAAAEEHMLATIEDQRARYERGLAFLGTLGNNAPFIGLFGTVLGIIRAFHDLSGDLGAGGEAVMDGIAESLVATCIGLVVALPSVAIYNACARHVDRSTSAAEAVGHTLLGYLKRDGQGASPALAAPTATERR